MKTKEKVTCMVNPQYLTDRDPGYLQKFPQILFDRSLRIDCTMKGLVRIEDLYKDRTTFYKTLKKGESSASPYMDCLIAIKVKIEIDGEVRFCHQNFDRLDYSNEDESFIQQLSENEIGKYDLEEY